MTRVQSTLAFGFLVAVLFAGWLSFAHNRVPSPSQTALDSARLVVAAAAENEPATEDEKEILREVMGVFAGVDDPHRPLQISGTVTTVDPTDSFNTGRYPFLYATDGQAAYCRQGEQEVLLTPARCVMSDKGLKRILIGPAKTAENGAALPFGDAVKLIKSEGYRLQKSVSGDTATVLFLAENHVSCKEMRIRYLVAQKRPVSLFYRLTDLDHFDETAFDKALRIDFAEWHVQEAGFTPAPFPVIVEAQGEAYRPAKGYTEAEIINLNQR